MFPSAYLHRNVEGERIREPPHPPGASVGCPAISRGQPRTAFLMRQASQEAFAEVCKPLPPGSLSFPEALFSPECRRWTSWLSKQGITERSAIEPVPIGVVGSRPPSCWLGLRAGVEELKRRQTLIALGAAH